MKYKKYTAKIELDEEDNILHGQVIGLRDYIVFEGKTVQELRKSFHAAVDGYLAYCKSRGEDPEKPYSGNIALRIDPNLHWAISAKASEEGKSLNAWIEEKLAKEIGGLTEKKASRPIVAHPRISQTPLKVFNGPEHGTFEAQEA
jgi:predicted HicB family RNase H-like nuclease